MSRLASDSSLRRAVVLMAATSFLTPFGGVITAPLLARALSTDGRGELAAAIAPAALMLAVATLGLPDALTYFVAKCPGATRRAVAYSAATTVLLGLACLFVTWLATPFLSAGSEHLSSLILLATASTIPALVVNVLRGAAVGRQMWRHVAAERVIITAFRIFGFGGLFVLGQLTVFNAVLINVLPPIVAGVIYAGLLRRSRSDLDPGPADSIELHSVAFRAIASYGGKVWLGSVASMLLARAGQLLMAPLSDVSNLGLYSVATTISDLPLVVALAVQGALFGVNSRAADAKQLTTVGRLTALAGLIGCALMAVVLPGMIGPLFGDEFRAATAPTILLLLSALICIPGLTAATALSAWGRPELRSLGLAVTLVVNVGAFLLLVPPFGVYGAAWTSVISNLTLTTYMVGRAARVTGASIGDFVIIRRADVSQAILESQRLLLALRRH